MTRLAFGLSAIPLYLASVALAQAPPGVPQRGEALRSSSFLRLPRRWLLRPCFHLPRRSRLVALHRLQRQPQRRRLAANCT
jgi:hypothetical protein